MKQKYEVQFWYNTDLRHHWIGEATNTTAALVLAEQDQPQVANWCCNAKGFYVKIKLL